MSKLLLGIDIGTSACKVAAFDENGKVVAATTDGYPVYYPQNGWAEQTPDDWWGAVCLAIKKMIHSEHIDPTQIVGIGIDGQSWSAIAMDQEGDVLCNTPIWMDTRADEICTELNEKFGEDTFFGCSGNPLKPSYTLPKILWYKKYRPDVYNNTYKILQSNSFIAYRLTGAISQDKSQGYGLACYDMKNCTWDKELCEKIGINPELLPDIYDCHQVVGTVNEKASKATGLPVGIPVVAGGLDAACGTLGAGVIADRQTQEQGGQAGGMSICSSEYIADKRLILSNHVVPGKWLLQGGTVGGGGALRWFEKEFGEEERQKAAASGTSSFEELSTIADAIPAGSEGVIFLPYMSGERSPIWEPKAKGVYYGLDYAKSRAHMARATMEGVAFSLEHNLQAAAEAGATCDSLVAMGGAANSLVWTQIKSDVTGKEVIVPSSDTATTLGAAILAGVGVGMYSSFEEAVEKTVTVMRKHTPNMLNHEMYQKMYKKYLKIYDNLSELMKDDEN